MEKCINRGVIGKYMSLDLLITLENVALCIGQKNSNQFLVAKVHTNIVKSRKSLVEELLSNK